MNVVAQECNIQILEGRNEQKKKSSIFDSCCNSSCTYQNLKGFFLLQGLGLVSKSAVMKLYKSQRKSNAQNVVRKVKGFKNRYFSSKYSS